MTRNRMALMIVPAVAVAGGLLAGCGAQAAQAASSDVNTEASALQQVGYDTGMATSGVTKQNAGKIRKYLRKNTLHGEFTIKGKKGDRTIDVQRGAITAVGNGSLTVKSSDGYSMTWSLPSTAHVRQDKKKVTTSALKAGEQIGVAGVKSGSTAGADVVVAK